MKNSVDLLYWIVISFFISNILATQAQNWDARQPISSLIDRRSFELPTAPGERQGSNPQSIGILESSLSSHPPTVSESDDDDDDSIIPLVIPRLPPTSDEEQDSSEEDLPWSGRSPYQWQPGLNWNWGFWGNMPRQSPQPTPQFPNFQQPKGRPSPTGPPLGNPAKGNAGPARPPPPVTVTKTETSTTTVYRASTITVPGGAAGAVSTVYLTSIVQAPPTTHTVTPLGYQSSIPLRGPIGGALGIFPWFTNAPTPVYLPSTVTQYYTYPQLTITESYTYPQTTITQFYTYPQSTITQFYTYPQQTVTVTSMAQGAICPAVFPQSTPFVQSTFAPPNVIPPTQTEPNILPTSEQPVYLQPTSYTPFITLPTLTTPFVFPQGPMTSYIPNTFQTSTGRYCRTQCDSWLDQYPASERASRASSLSAKSMQQPSAGPYVGGQPYAQYPPSPWDRDSMTRLAKGDHHSVAAVVEAESSAPEETNAAIRPDDDMPNRSRDRVPTLSRARPDPDATDYPSAFTEASAPSPQSQPQQAAVAPAPQPKQPKRGKTGVRDQDGLEGQDEPVAASGMGRAKQKEQAQQRASLLEAESQKHAQQQAQQYQNSAFQPASPFLGSSWASSSSSRGQSSSQSSGSRNLGGLLGALFGNRGKQNYEIPENIASNSLYDDNGVEED